MFLLKSFDAAKSFFKAKFPGSSFLNTEFLDFVFEAVEIVPLWVIFTRFLWIEVEWEIDSGGTAGRFAGGLGKIIGRIIGRIIGSKAGIITSAL